MTAADKGAQLRDRVAQLERQLAEGQRALEAARQAAVPSDSAELYRELRQFRATLDQTSDCVFMFDADSLRMIYVNQGAIDQVGYSREELLTMTPLAIKSALSAAEYRAILAPLARGELSSFTFETLHRHKDGHTIEVEVTVQYVDPPDGEPRFVSVVRDISERKAAERSIAEQAETLARATRLLEERNRELDQFAYSTSHDLKAPLRGIANLAQWIEEDLGDQATEAIRAQLELLRGRVHRMEALIDGILQYSRVGRSADKTEPVPVGQLIEEVIDLLAPPPAATISVGPAMPTLMTDRVQLGQVFANLIGNALKHHDGPAPQIAVTVRDLGSSCEFAVADDGPGIPPQFHERIFGIFQTLASRDRVEGSGLGLALVKKIVERQGGQVGLRSEEGRGATFFFTWPSNRP